MKSDVKKIILRLLHYEREERRKKNLHSIFLKENNMSKFSYERVKNR